ncbi:MAG TPA: type II toxin-antitoxin system prevent-host-death family antitoxin [Thermoanaerobaculia bacterium]|nr:type II toxin-antitoxin system prevent-host-death family antitoxin [Thermoanaerobaculia bacterium]
MRKIPQRELRNQSGEILRETEKGESFLITVEGRPIALLTPYPKKRWVPKAEAMKLLRDGRPDPGFFEDVAELGTLDDLGDPWQR